MALKANELRMGSVVDFETLPCEVVSVGAFESYKDVEHGYQVKYLDTNAVVVRHLKDKSRIEICGINEVRGIPLSHDLLIACGFEERNELNPTAGRCEYHFIKAEALGQDDFRVWFFGEDIEVSRARKIYPTLGLTRSVNRMPQSTYPSATICVNYFHELQDAMRMVGYEIHYPINFKQNKRF